MTFDLRLDTGGAMVKRTRLQGLAGADTTNLETVLGRGYVGIGPEES
jgi:hypothetical protein